MKFRWTMKTLREESDEYIIRGILTERISTLNPYTPLCKRLKKIRERMDAEVARQNAKNTP